MKISYPAIHMKQHVEYCFTVLCWKRSLKLTWPGKHPTGKGSFSNRHCSQQPSTARKSQKQISQEIPGSPDMHTTKNRPSFKVKGSFTTYHVRWVWPPPRNSGKWRFILGSSTEHVSNIPGGWNPERLGATPNIYSINLQKQVNQGWQGCKKKPRNFMSFWISWLPWHPTKKGYDVAIPRVGLTVPIPSSEYDFRCSPFLRTYLDS